MNFAIRAGAVLLLFRVLTLSVLAGAARPVAIGGQTTEASSHSVGIGVGVHGGEFGGEESSGFAVVALAWLRLAPVAAIRADLTYALNLNSGLKVCVFDPCAPGSPKLMPAIGVSAMLGNLVTNSNRAYLLGGVEALATGGGHGLGGDVIVPKLGIGALFSHSIFVEFTGRWRTNWGGWPLRHWIIMAGWHGRPPT